MSENTELIAREEFKRSTKKITLQARPKQPRFHHRRYWLQDLDDSWPRIMSKVTIICRVFPHIWPRSLGWSFPLLCSSTDGLMAWCTWNCKVVPRKTRWFTWFWYFHFARSPPGLKSYYLNVLGSVNKGDILCTLMSREALCVHSNPKFCGAHDPNQHSTPPSP